MSDAPSEGANRREIAYRLFAAEYDDADLSYSEGEEERAPNYVVTPTGARVNRAFFVGVLTEVEAVSEDVLRARVVDPTGAFVLYAGQYQPDEQAFLEGAETPTFVAVTGKARTFRPEDADRVYTSIRPETINEVDADTRDRWTVGTAERTLQRVGWMARAIRSDRHGSALETALVSDGVDEGFASGIVRALDHYGTSPAYLSAVADMALDAARLVAGETDEAETVSVPPDAAGEADLDRLAEYADLATVHAGEPTTSTAVAGTSEPEPAEGDTDGQETASADSRAETATATTTGGGGKASTESESDAAERTASPESDSTGEPAGDATTVQATETAPAAGTESDEQADADETTGEVGDFEPGEFDLDDEEREEIEEEFGTEFQSGTEVDDPGEADIETPEPDETATEPQAGGDSSTAAADGTTAESPVDEESAPSAVEEKAGSAEGADTTTAETDGPAHEAADGTETVETDDAETGAADVETDDVDLEDATLEVMGELDDGAGADRQAVIEAMTDRYGVDAEDVEEAIQDALMDGRCYEPDDATLKPI